MQINYSSNSIKLQKIAVLSVGQYRMYIRYFYYYTFFIYNICTYIQLRWSAKNAIQIFFQRSINFCEDTNI